jgi:DNA-binding HxlR family transcriptional regulator
MDKENFKKYGNPENCPVRNVLDRIGDKWSMLILLLLDDEKILRFNEMHKCIGTISQKMLTVTLKSLEADGLVKRTVYPEIPPRVEYQLTERAHGLMPIIRSLVIWAQQNMKEILNDRMISMEKAG